MEFHPDKCQVMNLTKKHNVIHSEYSIHNQILKETTSAKYLGVIVDNKLQWKEQQEAICKKGNGLVTF